jgi:NADH:ubiquinone oxidoreductase subunit E
MITSICYRTECTQKGQVGLVDQTQTNLNRSIGNTPNPGKLGVLDVIRRPSK